MRNRAKENCMEKKVKPFEIEINSIGYYLTRVLYTLIKRLNKELKDNDLKLLHSDFTIMMTLEKVKEANQSQIATLLGKERSGISRSLNSLEQQGYVERRPLNGSTNVVTLTEKGQALMPLLNQIAQKISELALQGFSQKSRMNLFKSLNKIYLNSLSD